MLLLFWSFIAISVMGLIIAGIVHGMNKPAYIIWITGEHDYIRIAEAPDDPDYSQTLSDRNDPVVRAILDCNSVPLLLGQTDDGKAHRQLVLHKRRNKR